MANSPKASKAIKKEKKGKDGPKRALSAFMIYARDNRMRIIKENGFTPRDIGPIGKKMGELWTKMTDKEKAPYNEMAAKDKVRYEKEKAAHGK